MISPAVLRKISMTFVANRFHGFRAINRNITENSAKCNVAVKDDMPVQLENPYVKEKRLCILCKFDIEPDYKNVRLLSQFQSRHTGRIYEKHITGLCEYKQKRLEEEIMKSQNAGLMGYMTKDPEYVNDPSLFDPNHPFKLHKY